MPRHLAGDASASGSLHALAGRTGALFEQYWGSSATLGLSFLLPKCLTPNCVRPVSD